jgi:adenylate kinase family enzyme
MESFPYKQIVVIGPTSSGKSTLAKRLAGNFALDFIDLDKVHWEPNWHAADDQVFRGRVAAATSVERWVVAGNYQVVRDIVWSRAEAVVWIDYSFLRVFWQLTRRTIQRGITREELWNGNREKFWWHLKLWSDESLFRWLFKTYWRLRKTYPQYFAEPRFAHLKVLHFRSPREVDDWVRSFSSALPS